MYSDKSESSSADSFHHRYDVNVNEGHVTID